MNTKLVVCALSATVLVPMILVGQVAREHNPVPLKNWAAPLYWQPSQAEERDPSGPLPSKTPLATGTNLPLGGAALVFVAMTPCRLLDTRSGQGFTGGFGPPSILGGLPVRSIPIQTSTTCPIPPVAQAYSFNVTVVPPGSLIYLTLYPATAGTQPPPPNASTLNAPNGGIVANAAIVPAGTDGHGGVDVYASNPTDLIIDINGYYAAPGDLSGNVALGGGALGSNTTGTNNMASGFNALGSNTTGSQNAASGSFALLFNSTGSNNTADGASALSANTTGSSNTASGSGALLDNTTGNNNTATGQAALLNNTTGSSNTAIGQSALFSSSTASNNTAVGTIAMFNNTTGNGNTALGFSSLWTNVTGVNNTAVGNNALYTNNSNGNTAIGNNAMGANTVGFQNVAVGLNTLHSNTSGNGNTALGQGALGSATTGSINIAVGQGAGFNVIGGSDNIDIGNEGVASDNGTIRIGNAGTQTSFFAAGIRGTTTGNSDAIPVVIDSNGQLGTVNSSARFKEDIHDMGEASSGLLQLRPVTFRYRQPFADGSKPAQYGLIAEEVEKVYPDLVAHSADGQIESVKYQVLDSMLLNEVQKLAEEVRVLKERLAASEARPVKVGKLRHALPR